MAVHPSGAAPVWLLSKLATWFDMSFIKTAKTLNLRIPPALLTTADEVIE